MKDKGINGIDSAKIKRYNQIDFQGSYVIEDNYRIGAGSRNKGKEETVSVLKWVCIFVLVAVPLVNFIPLLIMAFADINLNIKNFAKAMLIFMSIVILLFLLLI